MIRRQAFFYPTLLCIFLALLLAGCAATQERTQNLVTTEYFLQQAGFQMWAVNDTTPKRRALLDAIPRGKITAFEKDGVPNYYAYTDENAQRLYIGDDAAYQKYLTISKGRNLCEKVTAPNSSHFWSCYDEYQKRGGK
jgi:hypothetical protein